MNQDDAAKPIASQMPPCSGFGSGFIWTVFNPPRIVPMPLVKRESDEPIIASDGAAYLERWLMK